MKTIAITMCFLLTIGLAGCSKDEVSSVSNNQMESCISGEIQLFKSDNPDLENYVSIIRLNMPEKNDEYNYIKAVVVPKDELPDRFYHDGVAIDFNIVDVKSPFSLFDTGDYPQTVFLCSIELCEGMSGCSSEENDGDYDKNLVRKWANTEPTFTYEDFMAISSNSEETTNGTWIVKKANGVLHQIIFFTEGTDLAPSPESPKTTEEFFNEFLPVTSDNQMVFYDRDYRNDPHYFQYYKGIPVLEGWWHISYLNNVMQGAYGNFVPIGELDVNPAVNLATAKKIVEDYIHQDVDGEGRRTFLTIMSFPENGKLKPRLVYVYGRRANMSMEGEYVFVDAQTGQLLYHLSYGGGNPFSYPWN